jgi:hypothetical protein
MAAAIVVCDPFPYSEGAGRRLRLPRIVNAALYVHSACSDQAETATRLPFVASWPALECTCQRECPPADAVTSRTVDVYLRPASYPAPNEPRPTSSSTPVRAATWSAFPWYAAISTPEHKEPHILRY